jgi:hypothetical protein
VDVSCRIYSEMACTIIVGDPSSPNNSDDDHDEQESVELENESPQERNRSDHKTPSYETKEKNISNSSPLSPKDVHSVEGIAQRIITPLAEFSSVSNNHPENGCVSPVAEDIDSIEELSANEKDSDSFYDSDDEFRDNEEDPQIEVRDETGEGYNFNEPSLIIENSGKAEKNILRTPLTPSFFEKPAIDFSLPYDISNGENCAASVYINEFSISPLTVKCCVNDKIRFVLNMNETASLSCEEKGLFEHIPLTPTQPLFIYQFPVGGEYHVTNEVYSFARSTIIVSPSCSEQKQSEINQHHSTPPKLFGSFSAAAATLPPKPVFHLSSSEKKRQETLSSSGYGVSSLAGLTMTPSEQLKRQKLLFDFPESKHELVQDQAVITMVDVDTEDADFAEVLNDLQRVDEDIQVSFVEETNIPATTISRKSKKKKKSKEKQKLKKKLLKKEELQVPSRHSIRSNSLGSLSSDSGSTVTGDYYNEYNNYKKQYSLLHSEEAIPLLSKDASDKYDRMEIKTHNDTSEETHESLPLVERKLENVEKEQEMSFSIVKSSENKSFIIATTDFSVDFDEPLSDDEDDDDFFSQQRLHRRGPGRDVIKKEENKKEEEKHLSKDLELPEENTVIRSPFDKKPVIDESIYDENISFDSDEDDEDKEESENKHGEPLLRGSPSLEKVSTISNREIEPAVLLDAISNRLETPIKVDDQKEGNQPRKPTNVASPSSPPSGKKTNVLLSALGLKTKSADEVYETEKSFDRLIAAEKEELLESISPASSILPNSSVVGHGLQNIMPLSENDSQVQVILDFLWKSKQYLLLFVYCEPFLFFLLGYIIIQNKYEGHQLDMFPNGRPANILHWDDLPSKPSSFSPVIPKTSRSPEDSHLNSLPKKVTVEEENLPNTSKPLLHQRIHRENISSVSAGKTSAKSSGNDHHLVTATKSTVAVVNAGDLGNSTSSNLKKPGRKGKKASTNSVGGQESKR